MTRPLIGISVSHLQDPPRHQVPSTYIRAVLDGGGLPLMLPIIEEAQLAGAILDRLDGLLLSGGVDIDPRLYGQQPEPGLGAVCPQRDLADLAYCRYALDRGIPVLGICRGIQVIAVAAGGSLIQDLNSLAGAVLKHRQDAPSWHPCHEVDLEPDRVTHRLLGSPESNRLPVNSLHHQAVDRVPDGYVVTARSCADGVIEGVEIARPDRFVVGVQWHPEAMVWRHTAQLGLFSGLVEAARSVGSGLGV